MNCFASNIESENENTQSALNFLDLRIAEIDSDLEVEKNKFKNFKEQNNTIDVD